MNTLFQIGLSSSNFTALAKSTSAGQNQSFWAKYASHFQWDVIFSDLTKKIGLIIGLSILFFILAEGGRFIIKKFFEKRQQIAEQKVADANADKKHKPKTAIKRNKTFKSLTANIYYYVVIFCWIYSILSVIGIPVGTLLAGAGIFSLAIGLGAQGFVSDIVSGFFILTEHQLDVGEHVIINHIEGVVESVGLRTTQVRGFDGSLNYIPNRNIETLANLSRGDMQTLVNVDISSQTPIDQVEDIISKVNDTTAKSDRNIIGTPIIIGPKHLENGHLVIQTAIKTKPGKANDAKAKYLAAYLTQIREAGIKLPD